MKILTIDTTDNFCSSMICDNNNIGTSSTKQVAIEEIGRGHAERLILQIAELSSQANCSLNRLDAICVNIGPGSFTGIRVGVAAARSFSLALRVPAIGVSAFTALAAYAYMQLPDRNIAVILKAYDNHYHCMFWQKSTLDLIVDLTDLHNIQASVTISQIEVAQRLCDNNNWAIIGNGATDFNTIGNNIGSAPGNAPASAVGNMVDIVAISHEELLVSLDNIARMTYIARERLPALCLAPPTPLYMLPYAPAKAALL